MKAFLISSIFITFALLASCDRNDIIDGLLSGTDSTSYNFYITKIADHPSVGSPLDSLSEDQYVIDTTHNYYDVRLPLQKDTAFVKHDSLICVKTFENADIRKYNIVNAFAGGRFWVWLKTVPLQAELTIYGSGVPIIKSERGILLPAR
jgi:hypothetical protein